MTFRLNFSSIRRLKFSLKNCAKCYLRTIFDIFMNQNWSKSSINYHSISLKITTKLNLASTIHKWSQIKLQTHGLDTILNCLWFTENAKISKFSIMPDLVGLWNKTKALGISTFDLQIQKKWNLSSIIRTK